ncbi:thioesterase II family protein [Streptomyces sp. NPDC059176]|uniref:thioesterase II family protein n=1 Tax=Streptomyces sp. NPDC059176 TaxID=3346758 RepID=UPI00367D524E
MSGQWFRRFDTARAGVPRLFCFPHAGGAVSSYLPMARELSPNVDVLAVQYPGRQDRRLESAIDDVHRLADAVAEEIAPHLDQPYAFFGHSMGAVVAYETARRLGRRSLPAPGRLFLSGRGAPTPEANPLDRMDSDEAVVAAIRRLGGTGGEILDDPEIMAMVMPTLRADYRAIGSYTWTEGPRLTLPFTVLVGDNDPVVTTDEAAGWRRFTEAATDVRIFPGGHFYLDSRTVEVARLVHGALTGSGPLART